MTPLTTLVSKPNGTAAMTFNQARALVREGVIRKAIEKAVNDGQITVPKRRSKLNIPFKSKTSDYWRERSRLVRKAKMLLLA